MKRQRGVTLIELVVTVTVIAIAGTALLSTLTFMAGAGTDYVLQAQAQSIANGYLDEILTKSYADPNVNNEVNRCQFDDVMDYQGLDTNTASDECGNPAGNFRVRVAVSQGTLTGIPAGAVRRIDVTVNYGTDGQAIATGYRTNHP